MPTNPHHRPQHDYNKHLQYWKSLSFERYCQAHQELIETIRHRHQMSHDTQSIAFNSPYQLTNNHRQQDHAVILIHGFLASPYCLHAIAQLYSELGITAYNLTLPGHGTCPGDLLNSQAQHWVNYAKLMLNKVYAEHPYVHLCGHSMGAVITNILAQNMPIQSIVELVPAHGISLINSTQAKMSYLLTHGLQWQLWQNCRPETKKAAYRSAPARACQQAAKLISQLPPTPQCALFAVASAEDATVAANKTYRRYCKTDNAFLYWYQRHMHKNTYPHVHQVDSSSLAEDIAEISHVATTFPPSDTYFGRHGNYHGSTSAILWGEYGGQFAQLANFKRLTFNPDFANMASAIQRFITEAINY